MCLIFLQESPNLNLIELKQTQQASYVSYADLV